MTPTADAVTLREHHTFAELPDNNYTPRFDDPRAGYGGLQYVDYAAPLGTPMVQRFVRRHRLAEGRSVGAHERRRRSRSSTTSIAARRSRFERRCSRARAGGTRRSRRPAIATRSASSCCPKGADPMDIRYNMINWVHRSTRGWSTGAIHLRSAHRRDHQGDGHARIAARPAGLPDLREPARAVQDRHRESRRSSRRRRSRASASSRRTRSATRSASATSTTTAPRAGSRSWTIRTRSRS